MQDKVFTQLKEMGLPTRQAASNAALLAGHANAMASLLAEQLADIPQVSVLAPPVANAVFARIPWERLAELQSWSFFWPWDPEESLVRWMTSCASRKSLLKSPVGNAHELELAPLASSRRSRSRAQPD